MGNARRRAAGRLDNDLDGGIGAGLYARCDKRGPCDAGPFPPDISASRAGPLGVEIGDDRHFQPGHRRHLVQEHRPELAGADQANSHRPPGGALLQQQVKAHDRTPLLDRFPIANSARVIDERPVRHRLDWRKSRWAIHSGRVGVRM